MNLNINTNNNYERLNRKFYNKISKHFKGNTMTPKEKAEELVERFDNVHVFTTDLDSYAWADTKQCALIAVDEVLGYMGSDRGYLFWQEVKQEIEKL